MTIDLKEVGSGFKRTSLNENFVDIEDAINNDLLWRDGSQPMAGSLDMNSERIINLPDADTEQEPVTLGQLRAAVLDFDKAKRYEVKLGSQAVGGVFNLNEMTYTPNTNNLEVIRNGQTLIRGVHYTEVDSNTVNVSTTVLATDHFVFKSDEDIALNTTTTASVSHVDNGVEVNLNDFLQDVGSGSSSVGYVQFGADPTGIADSTSAIQEAINHASANQVELLGEAGTYKITAALILPKNKGFRWNMERGCILDASAATTAFTVVDAYSNRAVGVSSDYTEGLHINGGMIKPSSVAGSYGMALFYVLNACSIRNLEIRGGANGLLLTKEFYCTFDNIKLKDADNIGLHIIGLSSDSGFNANPLSGLFITGAKTNLHLDDSDPSSVSNAVVFNSCTFENSTETSVVINGSRPVTFLGCYWEGNYNTGAPANGIVELAADNALITLSGCFMNTNIGTHDSSACSVGELSGASSVRVIDNLTYKRRGAVGSFYQAGLRCDYLSDAPNADFSNGGVGFQKREFTAGTGLTRAYVMHDTSTMARTVAPVAGNRKNCTSSYINDAPSNRNKYPLFEIDLTTAQNQSGWSCIVDLISYEDPIVNATRRGANVQFKVSAFKDQSQFTAYSDIISERVRLSSVYGYFKIESDGVSKLTGYFVPEHTYNNPTFNQSVEWQIRDFVCRNNGDVASINTLTDEAAIANEPVRAREPTEQFVEVDGAGANLVIGTRNIATANGYHALPNVGSLSDGEFVHVVIGSGVSTTLRLDVHGGATEKIYDLESGSEVVSIELVKGDSVFFVWDGTNNRWETTLPASASVSESVLTTITGTAYTLVAEDHGKTLVFTNTSAAVLTMSTGLPIGFEFKFCKPTAAGNLNSVKPSGETEVGGTISITATASSAAYAIKTATKITSSLWMVEENV